MKTNTKANGARKRATPSPARAAAVSDRAPGKAPLEINLAAGRLALKRILVPTDFSEHSRHALAYAARLAEHFNATIILVHVIEPVLLPAEVGGLPDVLPHLDKTLADQAQTRLADLARADIQPLIPVEPVVHRGHAAAEIVAAAKRRNSDLIVIATHGYTGFRHLVLGSTAERVVRLAPCPVLVVRERENDFD